MDTSLIKLAINIRLLINNPDTKPRREKHSTSLNKLLLLRRTKRLLDLSSIEDSSGVGIPI